MKAAHRSGSTINRVEDSERTRVLLSGIPRNISSRIERACVLLSGGFEISREHLDLDTETIHIRIGKFAMRMDGKAKRHFWK